ncbi:MAG: hypothetical protein DRI74_03630 [Bacteroidetes bacterium]|nr:MAG: hypothetical protein DRI74_03630 [Bacteroidota bacterium]
MKIKIYVILISLFISNIGHAQVAYEHISNKNIYSFLDELANEQLIVINSAIKPYSRGFIAQKLNEAAEFKGELNKRQSKELEFYQLAYMLEEDKPLHLNPTFDILKHSNGFGIGIHPFGGFYKDELFRFQAQPLYSYSFINNDNGTESFSYGGLEAHAYVGEHFGFYASLRDNHTSIRFGNPEFLTLFEGGNYKGSENGGVDWSEMRGGVTYAWNWGSIALIKDHFEWGSNQHGANIFGGQQPSFAHISLKLKPAKWLEFNYIHGWLVSEVVDSSRSYWDDDRFRSVFRPKWISANMFSISPFDWVNVSVGNSIIYSDYDHPGFWIPLFIYKSVDHTYNATDSYGQAGQNSQLFGDISIRYFKHLQLYGSLFADEIKFTRIGDSTVHNFFSWKGGFQLSNFPLKNLSFTAEYTRTLPGPYQHPIETTTYESNQYNLGHYLGDNAEEIYLRITFKPIRGLHIKAEAFWAKHGPYVEYDDNASIIIGTPFMESVSWENKTLALDIRYEVVSNVYVYINAMKSDISGETELLNMWTPTYYQGDQLTVSAGFNVGF